MDANNSSNIGKRLIPQILDDLATSDPDLPVYSLVSTPDCTQSRHVSAREFVKAVDKTAWWLKSLIEDRATTAIRPLGYIGPRSGRRSTTRPSHLCALFVSPKNNVEGTLAVLAATGCDIWVHPGEQYQYLPVVAKILVQRPMRVLQLPELDMLMDVESVEPFPYTKTFDEASQDPFCILHTSGTTGVPKPVVWTHALVGTMDAVRLLPPTQGDGGLQPWTSLFEARSSIYSSFPMSHGAGIIMDILLPALFNLRCVLGPPTVPSNIDLINSLAKHEQIDIWSMVPSLVDELGESPDVLEQVERSKFICASGGPVSPDIAAKVNKSIRVLNLTGTTEGLFIGNLVVPREDWFWFAFHPYSGFEFRETEPGVYEHWIHRNEHWSLFQGIFHTFPDKDSINMKDMYVRHPVKPDLWSFKGRSDDVVVLSNGYKIPPLATEAYITTHPDIAGCLVIGDGRPQPGLLIELRDPTRTKDTALFDSLWKTIEEAVQRSMYSVQLDRVYVAFSEPHKPFVRTDKNTVKRHATLLLYADFIERFYQSRDDETELVAIVATSEASVIQSLRRIISPSLPAIEDAPPDADFFQLGFDSIFVFRLIRSINTALAFDDKISPRHIYANPTLAKLAALIVRLASGKTKVMSSDPGPGIESDTVKLKAKIDQHRAHQSFRMNPFDYVNPNHYMGINLYFALGEEQTFEGVFAKLQAGLRRTLDRIPSLDGKMMFCSDQEIGHKKGDLRLTIPPVGYDEGHLAPRQLTFKDLSAELPSFRELQDGEFVPSAVRDDMVLPCDPFPPYPADIIVSRANFVRGGCILATNFHHGCLDGLGVMVALKFWAESCRYLDGDSTATCSWYDPESSNHDLPEILYEMEGRARPLAEVDPGTWGFLPFLPLETPRSQPDEAPSQNFVPRANEPALPPPAVFPHKLLWPPAIDPQGRRLKTTMFLITAAKLEALKQEVISDPESKGVITSLSDIVQAFFWRMAIRARHRVAKETHGQHFSPDEPAILELPIDGRPYFSALLPDTYMGSMLILNRPHMSVEKLCADTTTIGHVAYVLREFAARVTPQLFHDAFTLLRTLPDYDRFTLADMGLDGVHSMISNMMLFQPTEIAFGDGVFDNGGSPLALRPQIERGGQRFRFLVIFPMRGDGGVELVLGTLPEEREMLLADPEVKRYATLIDG
ncbi:unnamed protein product [Zymoseptoria tritici ST99CH_3D1]|nr:unnamed protein product [Zymoseptoria tritici ST99CH_3D1]